MKLINILLVVVLCNSSVYQCLAVEPTDNDWISFNDEEDTKLSEALTTSMLSKAQELLTGLDIKGEAIDLRAGYPRLNKGKNQLAFYTITVWSNRAAHTAGAVDVVLYYDLSSDLFVDVAPRRQTDLTATELALWPNDPLLRKFVANDFTSDQPVREMRSYEDFVKRERNANIPLIFDKTELTQSQVELSQTGVKPEDKSPESKPEESKPFFSDSQKDTLKNGLIGVGIAVALKLVDSYVGK